MSQSVCFEPSASLHITSNIGYAQFQLSPSGTTSGPQPMVCHICPRLCIKSLRHVCSAKNSFWVQLLYGMLRRRAFWRQHRDEINRIQQISVPSTLWNRMHGHRVDSCSRIECSELLSVQSHGRHKKVYVLCKKRSVLKIRFLRCVSGISSPDLVHFAQLHYIVLPFTLYARIIVSTI